MSGGLRAAGCLVLENHRYHEGQNIYLRSCGPEQRATIVFDNPAA